MAKGAKTALFTKAVLPPGNPFYGAGNRPILASSISDFRRKGWSQGKWRLDFPDDHDRRELEMFETGKLFSVTCTISV